MIFYYVEEAFYEGDENTSYPDNFSPNMTNMTDYDYPAGSTGIYVMQDPMPDAFDGKLSNVKSRAWKDTQRAFQFIAWNRGSLTRRCVKKFSSYEYYANILGKDLMLFAICYNFFL